jgi:alkanesulfonate monooxygenase SsuD/methylene tetrahydromethanopterin reductase-like flavin-dependent oxidoreductase (luciferase family)
MAMVEIGVGLPTSGDLGSLGARQVIAVARHAEQAGLDSVSVSDVLIGDGTPAIESIVAAAAAATATERVMVEFGVLVLPTRQLVWLGAQIAALQHISRNRIVLGVGTGGFPRSPFWRAVGGPENGRGRLTEAMLEVLPQLIAGEPTTLAHELTRPTVTLAPSAAVPRILIGGHSDTSIRRAVTHGDGWFPSLMSPATLAARVATLRDLAAAHGRPRPRVHYGTHAALGPDSSEQRDALIHTFIGTFAMTAEEAAAIPITGTSAQIADRLAAYADAGAESITVSLDGQNKESQLDTLAEARAMLHA